jgi:hypothetical protein
MPEMPVNDNADEPFEYWEDAHDAIVCFQCYLSDQWIYSFGGPAALDVSKALSIIERLHRKPARQLQLLEEVKAFASGVLSHFYEQQKKKS